MSGQPDGDGQGRGLAVQGEDGVHAVEPFAHRQGNGLALGHRAKGCFPLVLQIEFHRIPTVLQYFVVREFPCRVGDAADPDGGTADTPARADVIDVIALAVVHMVALAPEVLRIPLVNDGILDFLEPGVDPAHRTLSHGGRSIDPERHLVVLPCEVVLPFGNETPVGHRRRVGGFRAGGHRFLFVCRLSQAKRSQQQYRYGQPGGHPNSLPSLRISCCHGETSQIEYVVAKCCQRAIQPPSTTRM